VPVSSVTGPTFARFRYNTAGPLPPTGGAPDGEVEDYELVVNDLPVEFGDLPDSYGTTLGQAGAYHIIAEGFYLGFSADGEGNGNPTPNADGDDTCPPGGDDEDGVMMPPRLNPGGESCVGVYLTDDADRGGVLDAWMDFDANGWDPGDRIITAHMLVKDTWNEVCFPVPPIGPPGDPGGLAPAGTTIYSRFRLSEPPPPLVGLGPAAITDVNDPTGSGGVGEVEDMKTEAPTAVDLASFTARAEGGAILVEWATASEIDNLGFNLYRSVLPDGPRAKLNSELLPSQLPPGSPLGAEYAYLDADVQAGPLYDYWLEALDLSGQATIHGPVRAGLPMLGNSRGLRLLPAIPSPPGP
jgi:hypothetical protein